MKRFALRATLTLLVGLASGLPAAAQSCPGDINGDGQVTVDEILQSVNRALNGCPAAVPIGGPFDGHASVQRSTCADPGNEAQFDIPDLVMEVVQQSGSLFVARFTSDLAEVLLDLDGTIDAEGFIRGRLTNPEGTIDGAIAGNLVGDGLSLSLGVAEADLECALNVVILMQRRL